MIIGLSGYMKSGKDTVGKMINFIETGGTATYTSFDDFVEYYDDAYRHGGPGYPYEIRKFATKLKLVASLMTGIPVEKFEDQDFKESKMPPEWGDMTVRQFLQRLGTDSVRNNLHKDAWVISTMADYDDDNWIITDCRFENEAQAIKDRGGVVIRINRYVPGVSPKLMDLHESETGLDDWEFDYTIWNNGTLDDLKNQVREILNRINKVNLAAT